MLLPRFQISLLNAKHNVYINLPDSQQIAKTKNGLNFGFLLLVLDIFLFCQRNVFKLDFVLEFSWKTAMKISKSFSDSSLSLLLILKEENR